MQPSQTGSPIYLTIAEVAAELRISERWLADECRASQVEHVHMAGTRRLTREQVAALVRKYTVVPEKDRKLDAERERVIRHLASRRTR